MEPPRLNPSPSVLLLLIAIVFSGGTISSDALRQFTIINNCKETVWPAVTPADNVTGGGFALKPHQSRVFTAPVGWSGRIWGRTGCDFDSTGNGTCETGACGTSLKCAASGKPPASLAEFTLASVDFYDVSLVDGYNLPMVVTPIGTGNCTVAGCDYDVRPGCPKELAVKNRNGKTIACRSACDVYNTDEYCCRGVYGNPVVCTATFYSKKFKDACPTAYSYAYDDPTSVFQCSGADYIIGFCTTRKQQVCSYHDKKLVCNGSGRLGYYSSGRLWAVAFVVALFSYVAF